MEVLAISSESFLYTIIALGLQLLLELELVTKKQIAWRNAVLLEAEQWLRPPGQYNEGRRHEMIPIPLLETKPALPQR